MCYSLREFIKDWVEDEDIKKIAENGCNDDIECFNCYSHIYDFYDNHTDEIWDAVNGRANRLKSNALNIIGRSFGKHEFLDHGMFIKQMVREAASELAYKIIHGYSG